MARVVERSVEQLANEYGYHYRFERAHSPESRFKWLIVMFKPADDDNPPVPDSITHWFGQIVFRRAELNDDDVETMKRIADRLRRDHPTFSFTLKPNKWGNVRKNNAACWACTVHGAKKVEPSIVWKGRRSGHD